MIPDYQTIMLPLLELLKDGKEKRSKETIDHIIYRFKLTEEEQFELLPSGATRVVDNRVAWARTYLKKAGLIENSKRGIFSITERGRQVLKENPVVINNAYLRKFSQFLAFIKKSNESEFEAVEEIELNQNAPTPEESLEYSFEKINSSISQDLLQRVKQIHPPFFEKLVIDLLVRMGYGGSFKEATLQTKYSKDEGIDGIIKEDKLGLDMIYIQAKRWEGTVGRPELQKFVGALAGQGAKKGIFITTGSFSTDAKEYIPRNETKIVLIDGIQLTQYMIEYNLGVQTDKVFELKKIDFDYFEE